MTLTTVSTIVLYCDMLIADEVREHLHYNRTCTAFRTVRQAGSSKDWCDTTPSKFIVIQMIC